MGIKASLGLVYARQQMRLRDSWLAEPIATQATWRRYLVEKAKETAFGKDHAFENIHSAEDFSRAVPIRDYEGLRPYFDRMVQGEADVLWPGKPLYLAKTSGTTSGAKYIPLTKKSMPYHINSAKHALLSYLAETGQKEFVDGKMLFLQGSPALTEQNGLQVGRLSGITAHHVPSYLQRNRAPTLETNLIEDWETKVEAIVRETATQDMRLISGIPSWMQMYFERLLDYTGKKTVREVFPNFSLMVHGGVNYRPYAERFEALIGAHVPSIELYPASEGFIAYQDSQEEEGLLLELDSGMYYEFVPADRFFEDNPPRLWLEDIELGVNYALIINSVAGLWGYSIGDTVKFVSRDPHRIVVTGRIAHFTSAFGEHVIAEEVERAMRSAGQGLAINEFHVAPQVKPDEGLPYHEWFIETDGPIADLRGLAERLDAAMMEQNPYYKDLIKGKVLRPLVIKSLARGSFHAMMAKRGKLGGQNKVPRLANDRSVADLLSEGSFG